MIIIKKQEDFPIIYLRYLNNELIYIGESCSFRNNRHSRQATPTDNPGDHDKIIILKSVKNTKRRRYWEAFLISKMKPKNQKTQLYENKIKRENGRESEIIKSHSMPIEKATKKEILYAAYVRLDQFKKLMECYKL